MQFAPRKIDKQRMGQFFPATFVLVIGGVSAVYSGLGRILVGAYAEPSAETADREALLVAIGLCIVLAQTFVLIRRERHPVGSFLAVATAMGLIMLLLKSRTFAHTPLYAFSVISLSIHVRGRRFAASLTAAILVDVVCQLALVKETGIPTGENLSAETVEAILNALATYTIYVSIGKIIFNYRSRILNFHRRLEKINEEHEKSAKEAIILERRRTGRELHDVTAHHLTGIIIQSEAASRLHNENPSEIPDLLRSISSQAKKSLESLRQIVGVLRVGGEFSSSSQPTIDSINGLVDDFRNRIKNIDCEIKGSFDHFDLNIRLTCYRIIEESLTNVVKYAPCSSVTIVLASSDGTVAFDIVNSPPESAVEGSGEGFGLLGMSERVELLGGTLSAGPTAEGGWRVRGRICGKDQK